MSTSACMSVCVFVSPVSQELFGVIWRLQEKRGQASPTGSSRVTSSSRAGLGERAEGFFIILIYIYLIKILFYHHIYLSNKKAMSCDLIPSLYLPKTCNLSIKTCSHQSNKQASLGNGFAPQLLVANMTTAKKRKSYNFHKEWETKFFFTNVNDKCVCQICGASV